MRALSIFVAGLLVAFALPVSGAADIARHVIAGGGNGGESASYLVSSTLGQAVVGTATSSSYSLRSGFWLSTAAVAGVSEEEAPEITAFALGASTPNPSSGAFRLAYSVPAAGGPMRIAVYDISGVLVRELYDGQATPGRRALLWDGRDASGRLVASGVYLVRMEAPSYVGIRKLLIAR